MNQGFDILPSVPLPAHDSWKNHSQTESQRVGKNGSYLHGNLCGLQFYGSYIILWLGELQALFKATKETSVYVVNSFANYICKM